MATSDNNQVRKYATGAAILILGSLLLFTVIGILLILSAQRGGGERMATETADSATPTQLVLTSESSPETNEIDDDEEEDVTPAPTTRINSGVETSSTEIIAPLLSFNRMTEPGKIDRYLFQAAADVPLTVKLETNFDLRLNVRIVDEDDALLYEEEFGRGQHEITFRVRQTGEYRIIVTGLASRGEYIIGMLFATEPGIEI